METIIRTVTINPITSATELPSFPTEEFLTGVVQGNRSKMFFVGQLLSFWGYMGPTEIDVYSIDLDKFSEGEYSVDAEILERTFSAIKVLHFRNRTDKEAQLKDFGRIVWLLEENLERRDRFCRKCSKAVTLRFPDIFTICGKCGSDLEVQEHLPPRFRRKKPPGVSPC